MHNEIATDIIYLWIAHLYPYNNTLYTFKQVYLYTHTGICTYMYTTDMHTYTHVRIYTGIHTQMYIRHIHLDTHTGRCVHTQEVHFLI